MTTLEVAKQLVALCKENKNREAIDTLYADNIVSVEAGAPPNMSREMSGIAAVRGKNEWWLANHEIHSASVSGPWPHDERFIVCYKYDVTFKPANRRMTLDEAALYTVKDGKIVREEFFYAGM